MHEELIKIAVLFTCHNRKLKTCLCLSSLYDGLDSFNKKIDKKITLEVFLVNDGCTDGTVDAVRQLFPDKVIHVLNGNGKMYWAGGMRFAWKEALSRHVEWDYYLLLNDDVELFDNMFDELLWTNQYVKENYKKEGVCSGFTCAKDDLQKTTYGGSLWLNKLMSKKRLLNPNGKIQLCDVTNANILLVPRSVVDRIGILSDGYIHGSADYDYAFKAKKANIPVALTAVFCGKCDNDHKSLDELCFLIEGMSFKERKEYLSNPIHSNSDCLKCVKRFIPWYYPSMWLKSMLKNQFIIYLPKFYYKLTSKKNKFSRYCKLN